MIKVQIQLSKWSRPREIGVPLNNNFLLNPEASQCNADALPVPNKLCVLGFACLAVGAKPDEIRGEQMPSLVVASSSKQKELPGLAFWSDEDGMALDTLFANRAAQINDDPAIDDNERMKQLRELCKEDGNFEFAFVEDEPRLD
jgi:hypothetical protein